jgi:hypothetical protein
MQREFLQVTKGAHRCFAKLLFRLSLGGGGFVELRRHVLSDRIAHPFSAFRLGDGQTRAIRHSLETKILGEADFSLINFDVVAMSWFVVLASIFGSQASELRDFYASWRVEVWLRKQHEKKPELLGERAPAGVWGL